MYIELVKVKYLFDEKNCRHCLYFPASFSLCSFLLIYHFYGMCNLKNVLIETILLEIRTLINCKKNHIVYIVYAHHLLIYYIFAINHMYTNADMPAGEFF